MSQDYVVVYFDGVCNLCNGFIDFLITRDSKRALRYSSLQSDRGQVVLGELDRSLEEFDSILVQTRDGKVLDRSKAVLAILREMPFPWSFLGSLFRVVPTLIGDFVYKIVALNRYRLFGKRDSCRLPTEDEREFFL